MTIQLINLGTYANDGTGDDLRSAFIKVNQNFTELSNITASNGANLGSGEHIFAGKVGGNLNFKSLIAGNNITLTSTANTISIQGPESINELVEDLTPQLGGHLDLNGFNLTSTSDFNINSDSIIQIIAKDQTTNDYNEIKLNKLSITGNNSGINGDTIISSQVNNGLIIIGNSGLTLASSSISLSGPTVSNDSITAPIFIGTTQGDHNGNVTGNLTGNVTGNVTGNLTGNVTGNVTGTVSEIGNHLLSELLDVSVAIPIVGQALLWSGNEWIPGNVQTGEVTSSVNYDLGTILSPSTDVLNFGTITSPNELLIVDGDLGASSLIEDLAITGTEISVVGSAPLNLSSSAEINLNSPTTVAVTQSLFRLGRFTTPERDSLNPEYGDMIYNTEENKFQGYAKDAGGVGIDGWVNLH